MGRAHRASPQCAPKPVLAIQNVEYILNTSGHFRTSRLFLENRCPKLEPKKADPPEYPKTEIAYRMLKRSGRKRPRKSSDTSPSSSMRSPR